MTDVKVVQPRRGRPVPLSRRAELRIAESKRNRPFYTRFFPYILVEKGNPLLPLEVAALKRGRSEGDLLRLTVFSLSLAVGIAVALWGVSFVAMLALPHLQFDLYLAGANMIQLLFFVSLCDKLIVDFGGGLSALESIGGDVRKNRWDLLCLTNLTGWQIISAKLAVAQVRPWRLMLGSMGFRLGLSVFALLHLTLTGAVFDSYGVYTEFIQSGLVFQLIIFVIGYAMAAGIYVIEPRWRLEVLAAGSLAVSTQRLEGASALLSVFGVLAVIWISQVAIFTINMFAFFFLSAFLVFGDGMGFLFYVALCGFLNYVVYRQLAQSWIKRAYSRIVKLGVER